MGKIQWSDALLLHVEAIDSQHRQLVEIINRFITELDNRTYITILKDTLGQLRDYSATHFAAEEAFMESVGYPGVKAHKEAHERLKRELKAFREGLFHSQAAAPDAVRGFLKKWLVGHVIGVDMDIARFIRHRDGEKA